jgi:hypothetical protein
MDSKEQLWLGMACPYPSTQEAETEGSCGLAQSGLSSECQTCLIYIVRPYLKRKNKGQLCYKIIYYMLFAAFKYAIPP